MPQPQPNPEHPVQILQRIRSQLQRASSQKADPVQTFRGIQQDLTQVNSGIGNLRSIEPLVGELHDTLGAVVAAHQEALDQLDQLRGGTASDAVQPAAQPPDLGGAPVNPGAPGHHQGRSTVQEE